MPSTRVCFSNHSSSSPRVWMLWALFSSTSYARCYTRAGLLFRDVCTLIPPRPSLYPGPANWDRRRRFFLRSLHSCRAASCGEAVDTKGKGPRQGQERHRDRQW
ncbi:hypothetical protein BJV78DRAFT_1239730 [Lactifluus subvellereus]|nr:hypothetical protein BJV78DRAFT_1239730 [Lactifluus subvellereus]